MGPDRTADQCKGDDVDVDCMLQQRENMESLVEHLLLHHEEIRFLQKNGADLIIGGSGQFNLARYNGD